MKRNVKYSPFVIIMTILTIMLCIGGFLWFYFKIGMTGYALLLLVIIIIYNIFSLYYSPLSIEVSDKDLKIHRMLFNKIIPLSEIYSVELYSPTMAEKRICGSGGYFGYWGWFSERNIGKYFAYYGKSSDCFLVKLKSGRKYMLGCKDSLEMVDEILNKL